MSSLELLAPAGDWDCLRAAVANGADAVYFGLPRFNARMRADNFREEDLPEVMAFLHAHGKRGFVAFNVLVFQDELADAERELAWMAACGVDAVIVQDLGVARLSRCVAPGVELHASTQMTLTSPEGVAFARGLGVDRVVLARETSLRELARFRDETGRLPVPVEMFVHGALCVAYSGQCLTSEALGQRSANRGECAQACRMPYELWVDGARQDLGDRKYLLSPQDLAAVAEVPELVRLGVTSFKIEGRLKSPEYVAAICQVYRRALDAAREGRPAAPGPDERYRMEMAFSRGLVPGWMHGVNHQELVHGRFGKKRGAFLGRVTALGRDSVRLRLEGPVAPGDGVVFDTGGDTNDELGGRVYGVRDGWLSFERGRLTPGRVQVGDRVWKTDDPQLNHALRKTYHDVEVRVPRTIHLEVRGAAGESLEVRCGPLRVVSTQPLAPARQHGLDEESLRGQLGRLGGTGFALGTLTSHLPPGLFLPVAELNRLRRELVARLGELPVDRPTWPVPDAGRRQDLLPGAGTEPGMEPELMVLCRTPDQIEAAAAAGVSTCYADFEDVRRYAGAVQTAHRAGCRLFLATPRIQKAGEAGFFRLLAAARPDGLLIRNLGAIEFFRESGLPLVGDFSLNVANAITARVLRESGLDRLTLSYDLNAAQVEALVRSAPAEWFELTLHQHLPMFHMEHCVFAAFMSEGKTFLDCGRPCERHVVQLRDRVGMLHPLKADVGCRNTLFHGQAQSGAEYAPAFLDAGLRRFRVELLNESRDEAAEVVSCYRELLAGRASGGDVLRRVRAVNQLGVTGGTLVL